MDILTRLYLYGDVELKWGTPVPAFQRLEVEEK